MDVEPPTVLKYPLVVPYKLLMGPGPSNCHPRVMKALTEPVLGVMHDELFKVMDDVKDGIRYIFQTRNELTLVVTASGHGAMEAVFCNLIESGDKILVAKNGIWGSRAEEMAKRYGGAVYSLIVQPGENFSLAAIEQAIRELTPKLFFIVQGESSTGVYQPIEGIGDICQRYNCLLAVDAVASIGCVPMYADKWKVDVIYTGSQKVLSAPPGLAPISFSPRARNVIFTRKTTCAVFYFDMKILGKQWNCFNSPRIYHHTLSSQLLYALREALCLMAEEGLQQIISRHRMCASMLYEGIEELNLRFYVQEDRKRLPSITTIHIPENVNFKDVVAYAYRNYSLDIIGGLGPTAGKVFRIGIMGFNASPENVKLYLKALKEALGQAQNFKASKL